VTVAAQELRASYAFVERNINLTRRYWGWEVVWLLYTIANSLAVVFIAQSVNSAVGATALSKAQIDQVILFSRSARSSGTTSRWCSKRLAT